MSKEKDKEIRDYLEQFSSSWKSRSIKKKPEYLEYLKEKFPNYSLVDRTRLIRLGYEKEPRCEWCSGLIKKIGAQTCSVKCREKLKKSQGKSSGDNSKKSLMEKYGVDSPGKLKSAQEKRIKTIEQKYGSKAPPALIEANKNKGEDFWKNWRKKFKEKHGVENPGQLEDHNEKCKETMKHNYGVDHWSKTNQHKEQKKKNHIIKAQNMCSSIEILDVHKNTQWSEIFLNANDRIEFKCINCNETETLASETFKWRITWGDTPCQNCLNINPNRSLKEEQLAQYIEEFYDGDIQRNKKDIIPPYEIDIYIPEKNVAIEFSGLFWHNDLRTDKNSHLKKWQMCWDKGIQLINVFEDEFDYKKDQVINRLKYKLEQSEKKIYGRKCLVKKISTQEAKEFVNGNHIQGYVGSNVKLGLFNGNELVGVCTFAGLNKAKGSKRKEKHYELSRMCFSTSVVGGASKLFNYFVKHYKPHKIITYADLRWNTGKVYETLGFEFKGRTSINYWYIEGGHRVHRFKYRKKPWEPKHLTEDQLRKSEGMTRIWDCGNFKFEWKIK